MWVEREFVEPRAEGVDYLREKFCLASMLDCLIMDPVLKCVAIYGSMPESWIISGFGVLFGLFFHKISSKINSQKSKGERRRERVVQVVVGVSIAIFPLIVLC